MKIIRTTLILYILVLLMSACAEQELVSYSDGSYQSVLKFNLTHPRTKSATTEDAVNKLDILLFHKGILEKKMTNITSFQTDEQGKSYITLASDKEGIHTAYVFANYDFNDIFEYLAVGTTKETDITSLRTAILKDMPAAPFVMQGVSQNINFSRQSSTSLCDLSRVVSKFAIHNKSTNFELISARVLKAQSSSNVFPGATFTDLKGIDCTAVEATDGNIALYGYENPSTEPEKATGFEIKGLVKGKELTYTTYLQKEGKTIPLDRNTLYTININNVSTQNLDLSIEVNPWILGDPINEKVSGNKPVVNVTIDNSLGYYTQADSTITINAAGGQFTINAKANAECDLAIENNWMTAVPQTKAPSFIDNNFQVSVAANSDETPRTGYIRVFNKLNEKSSTLKVIQQPAESGGEKYMVLVVAGQSNATGYDQSPVDAEDLYTPEGALQLSYRMGPAPNQNLSIIPLSWCADDIDAYKRRQKNESGQYGLKGIHLPLAKELLNYIPAGYKIVVVPVSYTSSRFEYDGSAYGVYDPSLMRPTNIGSRLRWGENSAYRNTIVDRVKYLLEMDARNKFLGVVWCQGENDYKNPNYQYTEFTRMADRILNDLGDYGDRSNYGVIDKRSWYTYSSCTYWVDWYINEDASCVFGGYKAWNPDTYIHVPTSLPSNPNNGGPGMGKYHFGSNAYRTVAHLVAERMNQNGLLFNNTSVVKGHFTDKTTPDEAARLGGSMTDSDLNSALIAFFPENKIFGTLSNQIYLKYNGSLPVVKAEGLKDINGNARSHNALYFTPKQGFNYVHLDALGAPANWSISFMFKRTGNLEGNVQCLVYPDSKSKPFIGFRKYSSGAGVAKAAEFVVEPIHQNQKSKAVPGQFMAADKVRSLNEWVHYTITYNANSKETCIYMNGELVKKATISNSVSPTFRSMYVGHLDDDMPSAEGQLFDYCIWNKTLTAASVKKIFLMSYYGFTK